MRARDHVILSTGVSLGLQATLHSWPASVACFFSGVLIDIDHYFEYYFHQRKFPAGYKELVDFCVPFTKDKVYLIFHAWEYLFVLWALIYFCHLGHVWLGLAIGLTIHLILDQLTNPMKPLAYFLIFRIQKRFEALRILRRNTTGG